LFKSHQKNKQQAKPIAVEEKTQTTVPFQQAKPIAVEEKTQTTVPFQQAKPIAVEQAENSVATVQEVLGNMMGDAPACPDCGHITIRNGSCYKCLNCGNSLGCS